VVKVATAVSASCAVPAVFSPVTLTAYGCSADGRASEPKTIRLGDGGICDNQGIEALLIHRCDVIISVDASADVITEEGYRNYFPGGTKVIPILRQKYKDLLEVHARGMLGSNYIRLKATDEAKEMGAFRVRLTEKDVDTLVTAGRTMVSEQMPAIRAVLGMPHPSTGTSSPP
jgi:predicted acylesterase/phospholipase RssA